MDELAASVETLTSDCPRTIRAAVVDALRTAVPNNLGLFFKCVRAEDGRLWFTSSVVRGDPDVVEWVNPFARGPALETPWLPPHTDPGRIDRFVRIKSHYDADYQQAFEAQKAVFDPVDIGDQLRTVLFDGPRFLGWLGLGRRGRRQRFSLAEEQELQRAAGSLKAALAAAESLESEARDELLAVVRPDGTLDHTSEAFRVWLDDDRRDYLKRRVEAFDRGRERAGTEIIAGADVRLVRLDGPTGVRYVVTVDRAELLQIRPEAWLTPRQRQVARLAVEGASNPEIADILGISDETAKTHLANTYRRLRVGNRTELAVLLAHLAR